MLVASLTNASPWIHRRRLGYAPVQLGLIACELEELDVRLQRAALPLQPLAFGWKHSMSQTITWCDSPGRYCRRLGLSLPRGIRQAATEFLACRAQCSDRRRGSTLEKSSEIALPLCACVLFLFICFPEILNMIAVTWKIPKAPACLTSGSVLIGPSLSNTHTQL